jgi:hypothetical protein
LASKAVEFGDTLLLVARGKPVGLLHAFHHSSVVVLTWRLYANKASTGPLFAFMNFVAHVATYGYFAATQVSTARRAALQLGHWVTALQCAQFVVGVATNAKVLAERRAGRGCGTRAEDAAAALALYAVYLGLFVHYARGRSRRLARRQE